MKVRLRARSTCTGQLRRMTASRLVSLRKSLLVESMVTFIGLAQATVQAFHEAFQIRSGQLVAPLVAIHVTLGSEVLWEPRA
jgi:hypothetical protein